MEALKVSFFSLMSLNLTTKDTLGLLTAAVVYALRKKQLKVSFKDHFGKIIKIRHMSTFSFMPLIMFREVLCTLCQFYNASTDCSTKETSARFSRRAI